MRILIVEDDNVAQVVAKYAVQQLTDDFDAASTAQEAIDYANTKQYDVILMDVGLERGKDGFTVTNDIRKTCMLNSKTPVIAVTAHMEDSYRDKAIQAGMVAFINKPINADKLKGILAHLGIVKA